MASFWFWLIVMVGSTIGGIIGFLLLYMFFTFLRDSLFLKRGIPRNKKKVTEFIKENPERFDKTNPPKEDKELNLEEENKNAEVKRNKFREFEKLRRAEIKGRVGGEETNDSIPAGANTIQRKKLLSKKPSTSSRNSSRNNSSAKPRVKLDV